MGDEVPGYAKPHLGAMVLFMYLTGARPGEAVAVQWDDVDLDKRTVLIRETKLSKERVAHLPAALVVALANLKRIEGRGVFIYGRLSSLKDSWKTACKKAGIKRLTPHCCRHGFATGLLRRGVDVVTVAWLGGWKDAAQVLKTYGHAIKNPKLTDLLTGPELAIYAETDAPSVHDQEVKPETKSLQRLRGIADFLGQERAKQAQQGNSPLFQGTNDRLHRDPIDAEEAGDGPRRRDRDRPACHNLLEQTENYAKTTDFDQRVQLKANINREMARLDDLVSQLH
jgi:hypothetical protein